MKSKLVLTFLLLCGISVTAMAGPDWKRLTKEQGLPGNEIQMIEQDQQGTLWVGTSSGLARWTGGDFKVRLEGKGIYDVHQVGSGKYLVGTGRGIFLLDGKEEKQLFKGNQIDPIVHFKGDTYWALGKDPNTKTNVLRTGTTSGDWNKVESFKDKKVSDLYRYDGKVWVVGTVNGVHAINPGDGPEDAEHHLPGFNINVIKSVRGGDLWCGGMENGVRHFTGDSWEAHLQDKDTVVFDIDRDTNGHVWVATNKIGVWEYDGEEWTKHLKGQINMLSTTSGGKVWVSSQLQGGLRCWNGKKWTQALKSRLPFRTLYETDKGDIWAGSVLGGVFVSEK